jgi:hypothetical protein
MLARSGLQPNLPTQSVAQMRCIKPMRQFDIEAVRNTDGARRGVDACGPGTNRGILYRPSSPEKYQLTSHAVLSDRMSWSG